MLAVSISIFTLGTPSAWSQTTTTEATTTTSSAPTCSDPGPATVSESALCELAEQTDRWRAESLLAAVLGLTFLGVLVALKLWR